MPRQPAVPLELQHLLEKRDTPERRAKQRRGAVKTATKAASIAKPAQERRAAERRDRARRKAKKA